jgi:hypothetical protein
MTGSRSKNSCRKLFTRLKILPLPSLYIFPLLGFVIKKKDLFSTNNETHNYGTRQLLDFHYPSANLKKFQTRVKYMSAKIYSSLKKKKKNEINNTKKFESLLTKFLLENSLHSSEEFYNFA